ncbi:hypothetical protein VNO77_39226 [Canavalia gladiata]|uniref:Uncharacterized protein n=1 Tax=Canavalia gladiata TaxID=3824 RepID=A0AAN9KA27_CANGL
MNPVQTLWILKFAEDVLGSGFSYGILHWVLAWWPWEEEIGNFCNGQMEIDVPMKGCKKLLDLDVRLHGLGRFQFSFILILSSFDPIKGHHTLVVAWLKWLNRCTPPFRP